jgi:hypothetical protein
MNNWRIAPDEILIKINVWYLLWYEEALVYNYKQF